MSGAAAPQPLLTKDSVNLFGHRLPLAAVGAVVGVAGLILILRARSRGAQVASVGTPPSNPSLYDPGGFGNFSGAQDAQLANLQTAVGQLVTNLNQQPSAPPTSTLSAPDVSGVGTDVVAGGTTQIAAYGPSGEGVTPWQVGNIPAGTHLRLTGPGMVRPWPGNLHYSFAPAQYLGQQIWVSTSDLVPSSGLH